MKSKEKRKESNGYKKKQRYKTVVTTHPFHCDSKKNTVRIDVKASNSKMSNFFHYLKQEESVQKSIPPT